MSKLLRQNVGGTDYTMAGCALSATCATAAATAAKVAELTDGDVLADGMSVAIQFTNGNTAASPLTLTVGGVTANICDSRGQNIGGNVWQAGNVVTFLYTFGKFLLLNCVVDEVTLNNMNSVSSSAVSKMNHLSMPGFVNDDVFAIAERCPLNRITFFRGFELTANSPYGSGTNDFFYCASRLETDSYIRMVAFDVRSNRVYVNAKINGTWGTWAVQSSVKSVHVTITIDAYGNGNTGYTVDSGYIPISFRPTNSAANYPTIITCDIAGLYYIKPLNWGEFSIVPNITLEGDLILQSRG